MALTPNKINYSNGSTFETLGDIIWPVGSIYQSIDSTSPANIIGGTWTSISNRILLATITDGSESSYGSAEAETEGGSFTHNHDAGNLWADIDVIVDGTSTYLNIGYILHPGYRSFTPKVKYASKVSSIVTSTETAWHVIYVEGNTKHSSNMPPYITCYIWYRTA